MQWVGTSLQQMVQCLSSIPKMLFTLAILSRTACVCVSSTSMRRRVRDTNLLVLSLISRIPLRASSKFAAICKMNIKIMLNIDLSLELVESMIDGRSPMVGMVVLVELKNSMEKFLKQGLVRGCNVNLREAFDTAWSELVLLEDPVVIEMDTFEDYFEENRRLV